MDLANRGYFFEAKRGPRTKAFGKHCSIHKSSPPRIPLSAVFSTLLQFYSSYIHDESSIYAILLFLIVLFIDFDMYMNHKMHRSLVISLYFLLNALHVSDCISPSSGATFISCTSHLVYAGICRYVWLLCGYSHTTARRMVPACTKGDIQFIKVAPDDGLI